MQSVGFPQLALHIARKDWAESRWFMVMLTLGLMVPAILVRFYPDRSVDFAKGLLAGMLAGAGFGYAQFCFLNERQRGTLELLLSLPIGPRRLVLAKYCSVYSMVLATVNLPALLVADLRIIFFANAVALSLATLFTATTVISDKPWAAQVPIYFMLIFVLPFERILTRFYPEGLQTLGYLTSQPILLTSAALLVSPILVATSVFFFAARAQKR